jgi:hypothetical protein
MMNVAARQAIGRAEGDEERDKQARPTKHRAEACNREGAVGVKHVAAPI